MNVQDKGTAELGLGGATTWEQVHTSGSNWSSSEDDVVMVSRERGKPTISNKANNANKGTSKERSTTNRVGKKSVSVEKESEICHISTESEEEETTMLTNVDLGAVPKPNKQNTKLVNQNPVEELPKGSKKTGNRGRMRKSKAGLAGSLSSEPPATSQPTTRTSRRKRQKK